MEASHAFISATKDGPDYMCVSCNRLMYHKTVQEFHASKYDRHPVNLWCLNVRISSGFVRPVTMPWNGEHHQLRQKLTAWTWTIPDELSDLNPLELCLISLRIPFMKMVNVPTDLTPVYPSPKASLSNTDGLWSWRGSYATRDTTCTSIFDQRKYLQLYSGWSRTTVCTGILWSTTTGSVMLQRIMLSSGRHCLPPPPSPTVTITALSSHGEHFVYYMII